MLMHAACTNSSMLSGRVALDIGRSELLRLRYGEMRTFKSHICTGIYRLVEKSLLKSLLESQFGNHEVVLKDVVTMYVASYPVIHTLWRPCNTGHHSGEGQREVGRLTTS